MWDAGDGLCPHEHRTAPILGHGAVELLPIVVDPAGRGRRWAGSAIAGGFSTRLQLLIDEAG
jgi:hypothetical protein